MQEMKVFESPEGVQRYTAGDVCVAAEMKVGDLKFWHREGITRRLSPARREGRWRRYNFCDVIVLACAQRLINLGLPGRSAIHWGIEAQHELRRWDYAGFLVVLIEGEEQQARFVPTAKAAMELSAGATVALTVNVQKIAETARARLKALEAAALAEAEEGRQAAG